MIAPLSFSPDPIRTYPATIRLVRFPKRHLEPNQTPTEPTTPYQTHTMPITTPYIAAVADPDSLPKLLEYVSVYASISLRIDFSVIGPSTQNQSLADTTQKLQ